VSWDKKQRGGKYYYVARREGSRTRKFYLGCGLPARMAAQRIELYRAERKAQAASWRASAACWKEMDGRRSQVAAGVQLMTNATLLAAGFHRLGRHQWRRWQHAR
jgi:hypothetical protein